MSSAHFHWNFCCKKRDERGKIKHKKYEFEKVVLKDGSNGFLKSVLRSYELLTGQVINFDKSELVLSKRTPDDLKSVMVSTLGVRLIAGFNKY